MFFLKKVFDLRDKASGEDEKPFLEHLEDLRITITRLVLTIIIATIACFSYKDVMMDVMRRPIDKVWSNAMTAQLPQEISIEDWEQAKLNARVATSLEDSERDIFFKHLKDEDARFHASTLIIYRALLQIPAENRDAFLLEAFPQMNESMKQQLGSLQLLNPSAEIGSGNNIKLMGSFKPAESFMLSMKLAFFAGIVVSFPLLLYFILQFILPGLKKGEKRALWPALIIGFGLFLSGAGFAYFVVLERVLEFFYTYSEGMRIENDWRIGYYISFATQIVLIFGLAFETPVIVMTFVKLGLLSYDTMKTTRAYAIIAILISAALITPTPDVLTLMLLAVPMYLLYEICIWMAKYLEYKERIREEKEEKEYMARLLSSPRSVSRDEDDVNEHSEEEGNEDTGTYDDKEEGDSPKR